MSKNKDNRHYAQYFISISMKYDLQDCVQHYMHKTAAVPIMVFMNMLFYIHSFNKILFHQNGHAYLLQLQFCEVFMIKHIELAFG